MITQEVRSDTPEPTALVLAIHGVGTSSPIDIANSVAANLSAGSIRNTVHAIDWNQITEGSVTKRGNLQVGAIATLATVLVNVSLTYPKSLEGHPEQPILSVVFRLQQLFFICSDASIAVAFWLLIVLPPTGSLGALASSVFVPDSETIYRRIEHFCVALSVPTLKFAFYSLVLFLCTSFLQAVLTGKLSALFIGVRRSVTLVLRPALFLLVFPLLFPWRSLAQRAWRVRLAAGGLFLTILALYISAAHLLFVSRNAPTLVTLLGHIVRYSAYCCLGLLLAATLVVALGPGLKILLDIFRYAGDTEYRNNIQKLITSEIKALRPASSPNCDFFILAHSLGSVIAVDALLNSTAFERKDRITLITMGSPLRRFFFRFFPNLFFPDTAAECAKQISSRHGAFRWINCYRPFDQIGTKLKLPVAAWIAEVCTSQFTKVLTAHPGYWDDPVVRDCIVNQCHRVAFAGSEGTIYQPAPFSDEVIPRRTVMKALWRVLIATMIMAPIFGFVAGAEQYFQDAKIRDAKRARVQQEGIETGAQVTYEREESARDETGPISYNSVLTISYFDSGGSPKQKVLIEDEFFTFPYGASYSIANVSALVHFVISQQKSNGGRPVAITMKYLRDEPDFIYIPQFPPSSSRIALLVPMIVYLGAVIYFAKWIWRITYYVGGALSELFIGQPVLANGLFTSEVASRNAS